MTDIHQTINELAERCRVACDDQAAATEIVASARAATDDVTVWYLELQRSGDVSQLDDVLLNRVARWLVQTQHALIHDHRPAVRGGLDQTRLALQELASAHLPDQRT